MEQSGNGRAGTGDKVAGGITARSRKLPGVQSIAPGRMKIAPWASVRQHASQRPARPELHLRLTPAGQQQLVSELADGTAYASAHEVTTLPVVLTEAFGPYNAKPLP